MSSPNHPTSDIEDAFSSNSPDYIPASPDDFPTSPRNTSSNSLVNSSRGVTSLKARSTETSDGLPAIQAQLNNFERKIKKVSEKVYAARVECELCKGPHYTKDCPIKEEGNTLEEAYYT
nr:hypothetical protein [Tanacetum cinerariifolium]